MQLEEDRAKFIRDQEEFKRAHRASWEVDVQEKQRFLKMAEDKGAFEDAIKSRRATDFAALQVRPSVFPLQPSIACSRLQGTGL